MKKLVLLIVGPYRYWIAVATGVLVTGSIIYGLVSGCGMLDEILTLLLLWGMFLTIIWNVEYVLAPSISISSNGSDIFSRFGLICIFFFLVLYAMNFISNC